jgi:hypothetical protein
MKFIWDFILRLMSSGDPEIKGTERRFRCRKCFEIGFFHADCDEDSTLQPICVKCGQANRLFVHSTNKTS